MSQVVVIGGGIVGASTALHLTIRDYDVTLIDREDSGRATDAGAGILYAPPFTETDQTTLSFLTRANRYYTRLIDLLHSILGTDVDLGFDRRPVLKVGLDESERETLERAENWVIKNCDRSDPLSREDVEIISAEEVSRTVPAIRSTIGGVRYHTGARVNGRQLTQAIRRAAEKKGMQTEYADAREIRTPDDRVEAVITADGTCYPADAVVIAGGAWSSAFADDLGVDVPVTPQRGQIVHLCLPDHDVSAWPIVSTFQGQYLVPWEDGHVAVGATHDAEAGFDPRVTAAGVTNLLTSAQEMIPVLSDATVVESRVGLRPLSPDGKPILGSAGDVDGAYVATGHGGGGLHQGPYSGKLVADLIHGGDFEIDVTEFALSRFS